MVVIDKRRTLIVSTAGNFFGISHNNDELEDSSVLEKFFNQASCRTLCAHPTFHDDNDTFLKLTNELPIGKNTLVFFKVMFFNNINFFLESNILFFTKKFVVKILQNNFYFQEK